MQAMETCTFYSSRATSPMKNGTGRSNRLKGRIYQETVHLGGKITAEHGIGLLRKPFLSMNLDAQQIELFKRLKVAFDPKNILNPGKIFDL